MFAALDVAYGRAEAFVACVLFPSWDADKATDEFQLTVSGPAEYEPGNFYRRELPCLLSMLKALHRQPTTIIIDGYVWLGPERPGLGLHLFNALDRKVPIVGVAKSAFKDVSEARCVLRGSSQTPLFVTSEGIPVDQAADGLSRMNGKHRIPTLLKRVDTLCRLGLVRPNGSV